MPGVSALGITKHAPWAAAVYFNDANKVRWMGGLVDMCSCLLWSNVVFLRVTIHWRDVARKPKLGPWSVVDVLWEYLFTKCISDCHNLGDPREDSCISKDAG